MRRIAILLAVCALAVSAPAQQAATTAPMVASAPGPEMAALPDAPSAAAAEGTAAAAPNGPAAGQQAENDKIIAKRSFFFPDLASNRTPLTAGEKFKLAAVSSIAPSALLSSALGAGISQATNSPSGYGQGAEGYGKRFGASMATRASSNVLGGFIIASIARQDPRYFVHGEGTFGKRLGHAVSRVVVAPNDGGGYGFNWGGVFGPLGAETLANAYLPENEQTGARTLGRYGSDLAVKAGMNVLKEFWPDIFKGLRLRK